MNRNGSDLNSQNSNVSAYIEGLDEPRRSLCARLREVTAGLPELDEGWAWRRPVYAFKGKHVCYMVANQNDVNFGFYLGARLHDPRCLLKGTGADMRHLKFHNAEDVDADYVRGLLLQAIRLIAPLQARGSTMET